LGIRQQMSRCFGTDKSHGIRVDNVNNYYQQEGKCDIIILSLLGSKSPFFLSVRYKYKNIYETFIKYYGYGLRVKGTAVSGLSLYKPLAAQASKTG
jgi:hypothetical protein